MAMFDFLNFRAGCVLHDEEHGLTRRFHASDPVGEVPLRVIGQFEDPRPRLSWEILAVP